MSHSRMELGEAATRDNTMPPLLHSRQMLVVGIVCTLTGIISMIFLDYLLVWMGPYQNMDASILIAVGSFIKMILFIGGLVFIAMSVLVRNFEYQSQFIITQLDKRVIDTWDMRNFERIAADKDQVSPEEDLG